jgi:hypothetical protein
MEPSSQRGLPGYGPDPPGIPSHGRGPQRDAASFGFERRNGALVPTAKPDPLRATAAFEQRSDGFLIGSILARR